MAKYIDAEALMDAFRKYMAERYDSEKCVSEENCKTCDEGCLWRKIVMNAPAADVAEVKHGEWIHTVWAKRWYGKDECGECGYHTDDRIDLSCFNYCPVCGAKMDGGNHDRQKAVICGLKIYANQLQDQRDMWMKKAEEQNAEIERLEGFAANMEYCANHALDDLEKEKAEAIKEFKKKLWAKLCTRVTPP